MKALPGLAFGGRVPDGQPPGRRFRSRKILVPSFDHENASRRSGLNLVLLETVLDSPPQFPADIVLASGAGARGQQIVEPDFLAQAASATAITPIDGRIIMYTAGCE